MTGSMLVVAGGSGGHIITAVSFVQEVLRRRGEETKVVFVVQEGKEALTAALPSSCAVTCVDVHRSIRGGMRLLTAAWRSVGRYRPEWVVGFGGFMTVPFVVAAKARGCKVLVHEQNVIPGRANRISGFFADSIAVSFEASRRHVAPVCRGKTVVTQFPLRQSLAPLDAEAARRSFGFDSSRFTLLVLGGSQGARRLNTAVPEALGKSGIADRVQVIHLCGKGDARVLEGRYASLRIPCQVFSFLSEMERAYSAADMAVSRAGSGVLHELIYFGVPSVLIPYPYAGGHQVANARAVAQEGAALMIEEGGLETGALGQLIRIMCTDGIRRKTMKTVARRMRTAETGINLAEILL